MYALQINQHTTESRWTSYMAGIKAEQYSEGNITYVTLAFIKV